MSKKQETKTVQAQNSTSTNTYGFQAPPETIDVTAMRGHQFTIDPHIGYAFGNARNKVANSFSNPLGGVYSPQMRDSIQRSTLSDLSQQEAQSHSEANQALQGQQFAQKAAVAGMTAPRMVQTGGTTTGTGTNNTVQSQGMMGDIVAGIATGAAATLLLGFLLCLLSMVIRPTVGTSFDSARVIVSHAHVSVMGG